MQLGHSLRPDLAKHYIRRYNTLCATTMHVAVSTNWVIIRPVACLSLFFTPGLNDRFLGGKKEKVPVFFVYCVHI